MSADSDLLEYYRVLEVSPDATEAEIRSAYRQLSKVWHPDRFQGDEPLLARAKQQQQAINAYSGPS